MYMFNELIIVITKQTNNKLIAFKIKIQIMEVANAINLLSRRTTKR